MQTCEDIRHSSREMSSLAAAMSYLSLLSLVMTSFVAAVMYWKQEKLMRHPNALIFAICLSQAFISWQMMVVQLGTQDIICYLHFDTLFSLTV